MKSIEPLTDSELDEIIDGYVDGVYPTWQEVSMAMELRSRRNLLTTTPYNLIAVERMRQITVKGWTPEHDDEHVNDELAALAAFYAIPPAARDWDASSTGYGDTLAQAIIPHDWVAPPDGDRIVELVKAGALIIAEVERLLRAAEAGHHDKPSA